MQTMTLFTPLVELNWNQRLRLSMLLFYLMSCYLIFDNLSVAHVLDWQESKVTDWCSTNTFSVLWTVIFWLGVMASGLAAIWPRSLLRILVSLCAFSLVGMKFSLGFVGHNLHAWMWASAFFALLPMGNWAAISFYGMIQGQGESSIRHSYNSRDFIKYQQETIFFMLQGVLGLFYFASGGWKLFHLGECFSLEGVECELNRYILSNLMAREALVYPQFAPFWESLFYRPWLGFIGFLGVCLFQLSSLYMVLKPHWHRMFGITAIFFHLANISFMGVNFSPMATTMIPVFIFSPLAPAKDKTPLLISVVSAMSSIFFILNIGQWWQSSSEIPGIDLLMAFWILVTLLVLSRSYWVIFLPIWMATGLGFLFLGLVN